jgi:Tfp pilus assembly protein PilF
MKALITFSTRTLGRPVVAVCLLALCAGCATSTGISEEEKNVKRATSFLDLGADHLSNNRPGLALREFLRAESLDPRNPQIQNGLGEAYWARDRMADAEMHFRKALDLYAEHHDSRMNLTALLIRGGRYEEAIEQCEILVEDATYPTPWRALGNQGWAELQLGRIPQARASLNRALEFSPTFWPATLSLAILESQAGRALEAVGLYQEILSLEPGPAAESETNYRLAEVYISLGRRDRALGYLTASVARNPGGPWAKKSEAYLKILR